MRPILPNWSPYGSIVPVHNSVAIGSADRRMITKIEEAVAQRDSTLGIIRFVPNETAHGLFKRNSKSGHITGWIPLAIICVDPPIGIAAKKAGRDAAARMLRVAKDFARAPRLVVIGISEDLNRRAKLIEFGCGAAFTLEETIAAIPEQLEAWLIYRQ